MINEKQIIDLIIEKIWRAVNNRYGSAYQETLVPYATVYEVMGRRGFRKQEARILGHFFESKGFLDVSKHGWLIKPSNNSQ